VLRRKKYKLVQTVAKTPTTATEEFYKGSMRTRKKLRKECGNRKERLGEVVGKLRVEKRGGISLRI